MRRRTFLQTVIAVGGTLIGANSLILLYERKGRRLTNHAQRSNDKESYTDREYFSWHDTMADSRRERSDDTDTGVYKRTLYRAWAKARCVREYTTRGHCL